MAKSIDFVALSVLFLMVFSVPAYAIGNAEGGINVDADLGEVEVETEVEAETEIEGSAGGDLRAQMKSRILAKRNELKVQYRERNCEDFDEKGERIKCRLVAGNYVAPSGTVPEACRLAENRGRCVALYNECS